VEEKRIFRSEEGGLCTLTLDRTKKLNALDTQTFEELDAHLAEIETASDTIGCLVLRANGRAFCAGADLGGIDAGFTDSRFKPRVIERLDCLPQPVIAAVHGVCFTGGLELALAADLILADATARFADTHGKWGLVGAWGMTQRLPRRIGLPAAKRMMMTSRHVSAEEAKELGLVDMLAEEGGLDEMVAGLAAEILANSWHTNLATKRLLKETDGMSQADGLSHEHYRYPGFAPDYEERIASFAKK
jgi:enoyl-CoA hydratase/carnithine racemase